MTAGMAAAGRAGGLLGLDPGAVVFRGFVAQFLDRQIGNFLALPDDAEAQVVGGFAADGEVELPLPENGLGLLLLGRLQHHQHALLAFGEHHLVGRHVIFALRHAVEVEANAEIALGPHLDGRASEAGGAHVLNGDDGAGLHQLQAGFQQALFGEGIADLHGRALLLDGVVEFGRGHGGAADAVATGLGTEIDDGQADALGFRQEDAVALGDAEGKGVDEAIAVVAGVEADFAADGRHAEGVAVAADTGDDAGHQVAGLGVVRLAEGQRVHGGDRPGAHGEHVAENAADTGRRALIGLDVGRVVVALHLEDGDVAVADVDDAGIFAGSDDDLVALGRQRLQPLLGGFVRAVLVPHRREDAEFRQRRLLPDQTEDALVFVGLQPVASDEVGCDVDVVLEHGQSPWRPGRRLGRG